MHIHFYIEITNRRLINRPHNRQLRLPQPTNDVDVDVNANVGIDDASRQR